MGYYVATICCLIIALCWCGDCAFHADQVIRKEKETKRESATVRESECRREHGTSRSSHDRRCQSYHIVRLVYTVLSFGIFTSLYSWIQCSGKLKIKCAYDSSQVTHKCKKGHQLVEGAHTHLYIHICNIYILMLMYNPKEAAIYSYMDQEKASTLWSHTRTHTHSPTVPHTHTQVNTTRSLTFFMLACVRVAHMRYPDMHALNIHTQV